MVSWRFRGGSAMSYYRLYFRDAGPSGPITAFAELDAADDDAALEASRDLAGSETRELWCGTRLVRPVVEASAARG